ncbi:ABC transporter permease [Rhizobium grahamii]|uniref:Inner-membrane translocator n=1 Tax=Rhizobium grahamii CCGE 502 TaxID=990285 RepID=S3H5Z1_9HYPH|nr:inner-membrane translocator [Rhizobium grahamii CCGE 502]
MSADVQFGSLPAIAGDGAPRSKGNLAAAALRFGSLLAFAFILVIFSLTAPYFFTIGNIGNVLGQSAIAGVLAIGLTIVLIAGGSNVVTGGIDLSLAANMGLSAAVYASLIQLGYGDATAAAGAIITGLAIGAVNAVAVVLAGIVPLLATLAVMNVIAGLELVLTQNTVVPASTDVLTAISTSDSFGIPVLAYILIGFTAVVAAIVQYTPIGLRLYAVGEFPDAARAAGLPLERLVAGAFIASGLCGGLAGILSVSYLSGSTTGSGEMLLRHHRSNRRDHLDVNGDGLHSLLRQRLPAQRNRRHLHRHDLLAARPPECRRHRARRSAAQRRRQWSASDRPEFLLAAGRHRQPHLLSAGLQLHQQESGRYLSRRNPDNAGTMT